MSSPGCYVKGCGLGDMVSLGHMTSKLVELHHYFLEPEPSGKEEGPVLGLILNGSHG